MNILKNFGLETVSRSKRTQTFLEQKLVAKMLISTANGWFLTVVNPGKQFKCFIVPVMLVFLCVLYQCLKCILCPREKVELLEGE